MICHLCGANAHTQTVLNIYQTEKVKEVCADCASDLDKLKADCRKLSDKTTAKINSRAVKIATKNRSSNAFWSLVSSSTVAIKNVFEAKKEAGL